jgi:hypothetical protein
MKGKSDMKNLILISILLTILAGCKQGSEINSPLFPTMSAYKVMNNIRYTLAVSKDKLGIRDTLDMTLTAYNQGNSTDTLLSACNSYLMSLTDEYGNVIFTAPEYYNNSVIIIPLNSCETATLEHYKMPMGDIFKSATNYGLYIVKWNIYDKISLKLNIIYE